MFLALQPLDVFPHLEKEEGKKEEGGGREKRWYQPF